MSWQERLAAALVKPRHSRLLDYGLNAVACVVIAWGFLVVVLNISAIAIAVLEEWFGL